MKPKTFPVILLAVSLSVPGLVGWSVLSASENPQSGRPPVQTITLKIDGWTCASCETDVRAALMDVPGVQSAEVSYAKGGAIVLIEPGKVTPDQLVRAIRGAGTVFNTYDAKVIPNGSLTREHQDNGILGNVWSSLFQ